MKSSCVRSVSAAICPCLIGCVLVSAQTATPTTQKYGLPVGTPMQPSGQLLNTLVSAPSSSQAPGSPLAANTSLLTQIKGVAVTIVASKQGTLGNGRMFVDKYQFEPGRDPATNGKVLNGPVTFSKHWGSDSMPLLRALETDELLSSVVFELVAVNGNVLYTVTLTNATVASLNQSFDQTSNVAMEDVRIMYQKIDIKDNTTSPATPVATASY